MKILALESSAKAASVCLWEDGVLLAESYQNSGLTHSRTLLPMCQTMLDNCGHQLSQVDVIAVASGPGLLHGAAHRLVHRQRIGLAAPAALYRGVHVGGHGLEFGTHGRGHLLRYGRSAEAGIQRPL